MGFPNKKKEGQTKIGLSFLFVNNSEIDFVSPCQRPQQTLR